MKTPATFLLLAALLASAATASAQTTFRLGLRGGANRALTTLDPASNGGRGYFATTADKSAMYAWQAGLVLEARRGNFALQPALLFSQKGEKFHTASTYGDFGYYATEQTGTNRYNWLELPLNAVYTLHGGHGLQIFAGPYVALAVGGRQQGTTTTTHYGTVGYGPGKVPILSSTTDFNDQSPYGSNANNRRLDAGVNFGVGYRQGPLQVQLGYSLGLRNLHQGDGSLFYDYGHNFNADAAYNRVAQLTGTYFFAL